MHIRCPRCAATNPASAQLCGQCWDQLGPSEAVVPAERPAPAYAGATVQPGWAPAPAPAGPPERMPSYAGVPEPALAGVWPRIGAYLVDNLILFAATFMAGFTLGVVSLAVPAVDTVAGSDLFWWVCFLVITTAYKTFMVAGRGQTLAKMLFGLRVVRLDGRPPEANAAFVRALLLTLLNVVPLGVALCAVFMERNRWRQGWHDKAAGTLVVSTRSGHR